jgi:hypothetical protein
MSEVIGTEVIAREKGYLYCVSKTGDVDRIPAKSNKTGTRKTVSKEKIVKEPGFLYFVGKDGRVGRTPMKNAPKKA